MLILNRSFFWQLPPGMWLLIKNNNFIALGQNVDIFVNVCVCVIEAFIANQYTDILVHTQLCQGRMDL